jgi:hypothetical protein
MDPTTCYLEMYETMKSKDFESAREHALNLRSWLNSGGFYPPNYSQTEVDAYIANVLRRTLGHERTQLVFSLTCAHCDAGEGLQSQEDAINAGWIRITEAPELPMANFVGICPSCKATEG